MSDTLEDLEVDCFSDETLSITFQVDRAGFALICTHDELSIAPQDARKIRDWWIKFCEIHPQRKEGVVNEFLTPEELQKHQDEQAQPLLTEAIQSIHKALLDTPQKGGKRLLRVDLRFEPVMPRVAAL